MANSAKTLGLGVDLHAYLVEHVSPPDAVLERLASDTSALGQISRMRIAPEQGALLTMLAQLVGAQLIVEVGTFTGYSSVCLARGLADGGRMICCDVSTEYTARAVQAWREAGLSDRIDLRIAPAAETLRALPHDPPIDMAFIDADKSGYATYYEEIITRMRVNGLIAVDNVLWGGSIIDMTDNEPRHFGAACVQRHGHRRPTRRRRDAPSGGRVDPLPQEVTVESVKTGSGSTMLLDDLAVSAR